MINFVLIEYIIFLTKIIKYLLTLLLGKNFLKDPSKDIAIKEDYQKLQVDALPIFERFEKLYYKQLLNEYKNTYGKELKPVKQRKVKNTIPKDIVCPKWVLRTYIYMTIMAVEVNTFVKYVLQLFMIKIVIKRMSYLDVHIVVKYLKKSSTLRISMFTNVKMMNVATIKAN
jgi:hypothetical protein